MTNGFSLKPAVDVFRLTRELIDIPSVTGEEFQIGTSLGELLNRLGYHVELQDVADERSNIIATTEAPAACRPVDAHGHRAAVHRFA